MPPIENWLPDRRLIFWSPPLAIFSHRWRSLTPQAKEGLLMQGLRQFLNLPAPCAPPADVWLIRFDAQAQQIELLGPFENLPVRPEQRRQPRVICLPLKKAQLIKQFHRSLPWSDLYEPEDNEFDNLSLRLKLESRHAELTGEFDLLSDLEPDSGYGHSAQSQEVQKRMAFVEDWLK